MKFWKLKHLLFPPKCMLCGEYLSPDTTLFFCSFCLKHLPLVPADHCPVCGRVTPSGGAICFQCMNQKPKFRKHQSVLFYTEQIRYMLLKLKFYRKPFYATSIGYVMSSYVTEQYDLITSVPSTKKRTKRKGYNPSRLIAEQIERIREIPYREVLIKTKETPAQSTLPFKARLTNLKNAFSVKENTTVSNLKILLIDDIYTTGSTVNECAKTLKKAGADVVDVLTFAMTDRRIKSIKGNK